MVGLGLFRVVYSSLPQGRDLRLSSRPTRRLLDKSTSRAAERKFVLYFLIEFYSIH
jgi:hypothetical protein